MPFSADGSVPHTHASRDIVADVKMSDQSTTRYMPHSRRSNLQRLMVGAVIFSRLTEVGYRMG
jgi:hypothetical protein